MLTLAGNKNLYVHFFLHGPRFFHLSTEKVRVRSVGNGHQSGFSRADTINKSITNDESYFHKLKILNYIEENNLKYAKLRL